jgi:DNA polymerase I-like protein with 3'-5' exonuclease and polymerase domains
MQIVSLDCEWNRQGTLLCLAYIEYSAGVADTSKLIPANCRELYHKLNEWKDSEVLLIGHNIKSDLLTIYENTGILLENVWDTMIAWQQITNGKMIEGKRVPANLGVILEKLLGIKLDKSLQSSFLDKYDYEFNEEERSYILNDIQYLYPLKQKLDVFISKFNLHSSLEIDLNCLPVLASIEAKGMLIDTDRWSNLIEDWKLKQDDLYSKLFEILQGLDYPTVKVTYNAKGEIKKEEEINFNSHVQVKQIFKHFGVKLPINKDDKESTNKDLLSSINLDNPNNILYQFISVFVEYKKISKLISGFGDNIINNLRNGKTLHTEYTQCFTSTGRLSSGKNKLKPYTINVQNIPARSEEGKHIMECIIAREGYNIVCCDMAGAELRIAGSLSNDELLIANFNGGGDFHSELATCSWQVIHSNNEVISKKYNPNWLDTDFRTIHKQVNFGILYGCSPKRISEVLHISKSVAEKCKRAIDKKVPKLMNYLKGNQKLAKLQGYLQAPFSNRIKYNLTATEASNWIIQCLNAEAMKTALYELHRYIKEHSIDAYIINTVHDSVVIEVKENEEVEWIKEIMANSLSKFLLNLKGEADLSIAKYWKK